MQEHELITALKQHFYKPHMPHPFEDDCFHDPAAPAHQLITTDMLLDGRHFDTRTTPIDLIARKCIAVNMSDIAASGGTPRHAFVSLAIPRQWSTQEALTLMTSMNRYATLWSCEISGGDTNTWDHPLAVNVTAVGNAHWRGPVTRSGVSPGDILFVTGSLGGSFLSGRHLTFEPRLAESAWLMNHFKVSAMMDLSDGLATDARRMATASGVDFHLHRKDIPIQSDVTPTHNSLDHALCDGEDFELLFALTPSDADHLQHSWPWSTRLTRIGTATHGRGLLWMIPEQGDMYPYEKHGYEHI